MTQTNGASPPAKRPAGPVGRPRLLTEVKKAEIAAMIAVGCSRSTACRYVGCVPETLRNELRRDADFRDKIVKAERRRQLVPLQQIQQAGTRSWRAAAWLLERVNPQEFVRRDPEVVTREQMESYVKRLVDVIFEEVPREYRQKIDGRMRAERVGALREEIERLAGEDPALAAAPVDGQSDELVDSLQPSDWDILEGAGRDPFAK